MVKRRKVCSFKSTGWGFKKNQGSSYFRYKKKWNPKSGRILVKRKKRRMGRR